MQRCYTLIIFIFILLLGCFFKPVWALEPIELTLEKEEYNVSKHLELFEDPDHKLTIKQVSHPINTKKFKINTQAVPNFGVSYSNHWGRFSLKNSTSREMDWLFELGHPAVEWLSVYKPDSKGEFTEVKSGRKIPFSDREIKHRHFVFKLHVPAHTTYTYYLKMASSASFSPSLTLMSERIFSQYDHEAQLGFGFYYGLVFIMIFYNLILFMAVRERTYLYYVFTLITLHALFQGSYNGLAYEYLWPNSVWWANRCVGFFLALSIVTCLLFTQSFLRTKEYIPTIHKVLSVLIGIGLVLSIFNLAPDYSLPSRISTYFGTRVGMISAILIFVCAIRVWMKGYKAGRYFLIAWSFLIVGTLVTGFESLGYLPSSFFTSYALQLGSSMEVLLLSLALGDRINMAQRELIEAQKESLKQERISRKAQSEVVKRLRKLDKIKDEFIANISHELRTPLNGIIGISESMIDGAVGELEKEQKYNLSLVVSSSRRLFSLVNDLIDFSQLKHKEIELTIKPLWLREIVEVVLKLSQPLIGKKEVVLINAISEDLPPVNGDEDRLQQILHNLVSNAIKFTSKGEVKVKAKVANNFVEVTVSDTGIGIPQEALKRIFRSFEQVDGSTSREFSGAGLGLPITKKLVELQGGKIRVDSVVDEGSHFHFLLPISDEVAPEKSKKEELELMVKAEEWADVALSYQQALADEKNLQVLIVDDEPVNLQVLVNMLSLQNYSVTKANNGQEALDAIKDKKFDLVLLDLMMPKMSGYEVCDAIRQQYPANELPIVFLTAKNQVTDLVQGFDVGANDYLTKPVSKNELLSRIKTHIELSKINHSYARFVPSEFLQFLGHNSILDVNLGDQIQQEMTVMFSDIRSFTSLSETLSPKENFDFINEYLKRISPIIRINKGFIDKYIGDAIMALFPSQADHAVSSAIEMMHELATYNLEREDMGFRPINIGIGLHTGTLMLGTIGEEQRMEGTVISDAVNVASRLEGLTKLFGAAIIISEQTLNQLSDPETYYRRFLGRIRVKGKSDVVSIFEIFDDQTTKYFNHKVRSLEDFEQGVRSYFNKDLEASELYFKEVVAMNPEDKAAQFYLKYTLRFLQQEIPEGDMSDIVQFV